MFKNFALRFLMACFLIGGSCHSYALTIEGLDLSVRTGSACEELTRPQAMKSSSESSLLRIRPCLTQGQSSESGSYSLAETTTWLRLGGTKKVGNRFIGLGYRFEFQGGTAQFRIRSGDRLSLLYRREADFL